MMIYLIVEANKHRERHSDGKWGFPLYVVVKQSDMMRVLNVARRETLYKARDELAEAGHLLYISGIGTTSTAYIPLPTRPADAARIRQDKSYADRLVKLAYLDLNGGFSPI